MKVVTLFFGLLIAGRVIAATDTGNLNYAPPAPSGIADGLFADVPKWFSRTLPTSWKGPDAPYSSHSTFYTHTFDVHGEKLFWGQVAPDGSLGVGLLSAWFQPAGLNTSGIRDAMFRAGFQPQTMDTITLIWSFYVHGSENSPPPKTYNFSNTGGTFSGILDPHSNTTVRAGIDPTNNLSEGDRDYGYFSQILQHGNVVVNVPEPGATTLLLAGVLLLVNRARRIRAA